MSGYDATFSAPKSLSVWWALTGDPRLLEAHDAAVTAALGHLEQFGSTTRRRRNGRMSFPDTGGLTMATFRQTTSRADDPQLHTHAVVSTKVQTVDGGWYALDGRYIKQHQRMLGGLYQSVLRAELTHRFGVAWRASREGAGRDRRHPTRVAGRVLETDDRDRRGSEGEDGRVPSARRAAARHDLSGRRWNAKRPRTRGAASPVTVSPT